MFKTRNTNDTCSFGRHKANDGRTAHKVVCVLFN